VDDYGNTLGNWSSGKIFKVEQEIRFAGIEEKLAEKMREYGVDEETITTVLKDMKSEVKEVAIRNRSSKDNVINNQGMSGIQGYEGTTNTFYGLNAGDSITTGNYNSFFGREAGEFTTSGELNTFIGCAAGVYNTTGSMNTFVGSNAGVYNTTGYENTFLGYIAGYNNTTGYHNTYLGSQAGLSNTTGYENTFLGYTAGYNNTTGYHNTYLGSTAGFYNTTGNYNTFIGHGAGLSNSTGYENTFLGFAAGYYNTTGYYNSFLGLHAGYKNTTGASNTFLGYAAGYNNTTGNDNTFLGYQAGVSTTIGNYNLLLGYRAGYSNTSGSNNTFIGKNAGYSNTTGQGNLFLGYNAGYSETGSNKLYIDNSNTSSPLIYGEFDNNIVTINGKLGIGTKTPAYSMELDTTGENAAIAAKRTDGATNFMSATDSYAQFGAVSNHPVRILVNNAWKMILNTDGSLSMANGASCTTGGVWTNASSRELKENIEDLRPVEAVEALNRLNPVKYNYKVDKADKYVGFIAEDVPELVATADRKGMSTMDIVAVLTKVVQEQQKIIADLQERMAKVEKK
jgi:membrane protease subunit (stomatin/prohibitin family)